MKMKHTDNCGFLARTTSSGLILLLITITQLTSQWVTRQFCNSNSECRVRWQDIEEADEIGTKGNQLISGFRQLIIINVCQQIMMID